MSKYLNLLYGGENVISEDIQKCNEGKSMMVYRKAFLLNSPNKIKGCVLYRGCVISNIFCKSDALCTLHFVLKFCVRQIIFLVLQHKHDFSTG
jgi:hypothetical protein